MMLYRSRVSIPSSTGTYVKYLDVGTMCDQLRLDHGVNYNNVTLTIAAWMSLIADSPVDARKPPKVLNRFLSRLVRDLKGTIASFSGLAHAVALSLRHGQEGIIIDPFLNELQDTPIFREYLHFVRTRDPHVLTFVLSFLSFGKKIYYEDDDLNAIAFRKWQEVEERVGNLVLPSFSSNLRTVMSWIFEDWSVDDFLPRHGRGSVSESGVRGINAKNAQFSSNKRIEWTYCRPNNILLPNEVANYALPAMETGSTESKIASRLKFVPKDWKTTRSICMEPIIFQWAQQGVRLWYEAHLSKSVLRDHVFIHDQRMNQEASMYGSRESTMDTIDLSSASDSVSWDLVKTIFPAKVLRHLAATRTRVVELPSGETLQIAKFAPMGSALCFPVQSTIYSAIVLMVSIAQAFGRDWRAPGALDGIDLWAAHKTVFAQGLYADQSNRYLPFRCYGDDIACDKRATSNVIEALSALGFSVNVGKSFTGQSAFRESCGLYHFDGNDVTPYMLKIKQIARRVSIDTLGGIISHANRALEFGYLHLRRCLIQFCQFYPVEGIQTGRSVKSNPILFSKDPDDSMAILSSNPVNSHLKERADRIGRESDTNVRFQRDEVRSITARPLVKRKIDRNYDNYRLTVWWRSRYGRGGTDVMSAPATIDALGTGVAWRWTAKSA